MTCARVMLVFLCCGLSLPFVQTAAQVAASGPVVVLSPVASSPVQPMEQLAAVVDGNVEGSGGWRATPQKDAPASLVLRCQEPFGNRRARCSLWFQGGGVVGGPFQEFALSATEDDSPSLASRWEPVFPVWFNANQGTIIRQDGRLRFNGPVTTASFFIVDFSLPFDRITGLRLDVFKPEGSKSEDVASVLNEIKVERRATATSNVALGCPVKASHPLTEGMEPGFLTDGIPSTYARPPAPDMQETFSFEVDLKRQVALDHLRFRLRPDALEINRFTRVWLELYRDLPSAGGQPVWRCHYRKDGSVGSLGSSGVNEVVSAADGEGDFTGRYLRIRSDSAVPYSPQIAEVEAYEVMVPLGVTVQAGEKTLNANAQVMEIPENASWLRLAISYPREEDPAGLGRRWRIAGFHDDWLPGTGQGTVESRTPPPGDYEFQAQIRHSDQVWNEAIYRLPLRVPLPLWQRPWAQIGALVAAGLLSALAVWWISHRVMAARVAELERRQELEKERARIARDMHDTVGSQLTQLAVLHEIVAEELALSDEARGRLCQLTDTARASVAALDGVVWAVNPGNDNLAHLAGYLTQVAREYLTPLGIACRQDVPHDWPDLPVTSRRRHQLFLAFQEALQNVVKHAHATEVMLTLRYVDGRFTVSIADNGVGLPADLSGSEKDGLNNMQSRLSSLDGHCKVETKPGGGGTVVELRIPL